MTSDPRTYIRVHDGMPDHPKIDALSDPAFRLLINAWCWCSRHLTDGRIPAATWDRRGTRKSRAELASAGLVEHIPGGVYMHDYLEHQRSADEVAELRAKRQAAGKAGGKAKASGLASAKARAKQTPSRGATQSESESQFSSASKEAGDDSPPTAQTLVAEWLDSLSKRPPSSVIGQLSKQVKVMLEEGIDPDDIRSGVAAWASKGLHPATLPSVVNEAMNRPSPVARPAPSDQRAEQNLALVRQYAEQERQALP